jgi:hypothetical protein
MLIVTGHILMKVDHEQEPSDLEFDGLGNRKLMQYVNSDSNEVARRHIQNKT